MNMSRLMVVQPLLDSGKSAVSGTNGKTQNNDASGSFQNLLSGQIAARQPEKPPVAAPASQPAANNKQQIKEPAKQEPAKEAASSEPEKAADSASNAQSKNDQKEGVVATTVDAAENAALLAQVMAAAAGAQIVPVEPVPGNDALELTDAKNMKLAAVSGKTDAKNMPLSSVTGEGEETVLDKPLAKGTEDAALSLAKGNLKEGDAANGKLQAEVKPDMAQSVETAAAKQSVSPLTGAEKGAVEQAALQTQQGGAPLQTTQTTPTIAAQPIQQAQAPMAATAAEANPAATRIMQQLGSPEWNQAIGQRVLWMVGQEQQSASLTLNPPELGPVRIVVSVSNNQASANFFSANPDVRQALEGSLPRLREMMEGAGIQLGQAQVGSENAGNPQSDQFASSAGRSAGEGISSDSAGGISIGEIASSAADQVQTVAKGLVDTFV